MRHCQYAHFLSFPYFNLKSFLTGLYFFVIESLYIRPANSYLVSPREISFKTCLILLGSSPIAAIPVYWGLL